MPLVLLAGLSSFAIGCASHNCASCHTQCEGDCSKDAKKAHKKAKKGEKAAATTAPAPAKK